MGECRASCPCQPVQAARRQRLLLDAWVAVGFVHEARVAAICLDHDVSELWSADRDFNRVPKLKIRNPLIG